LRRRFEPKQVSDWREVGKNLKPNP